VTQLLVRSHGGAERALGAADFPIPLGGPGSAVSVDGVAGPLAWLGLEGRDVFVQPAPGASVYCNGARLSASHWLRPGDVLRLATTPVEVVRRGDALELRVGPAGESNPTDPPVVLVPPPRPGGGPGPAGDDLLIRPLPYTPRPIGPPPGARPRMPLWLPAAFGLLAVAAATAVLVSRLALVEIHVEPAPDRVALTGRWPVLSLGSRRLAVIGSHRLLAEKAGYRRLEEDVSVDRGAIITRTLQPLPGRLAVETPGLAGAEVAIDGRPRGVTPLSAFEVEPGERELRVRAPGYEEHSARVAIEGRGVLQSVAVALRPLPTPPPGPPPPPRPGTLVLTSDPPGARVTVGGAARGTAPLELPLAPSREHAVRASLPGHADAELTVTVKPGERREAALRLQPRLGEVRVAARPPDAELLVDGEPRGKADQTLQLLAVPHVLEFRREGFETLRVDVTPRPGFAQTVNPALKSSEQAREEKMPAVAGAPRDTSCGSSPADASRSARRAASRAGGRTSSSARSSSLGRSTWRRARCRTRSSAATSRSTRRVRSRTTRSTSTTSPS
jgi:hypothetical protein